MTARVPPHLCNCLKAKAMYTKADVEESDFTSAMWCVRTMTALGPDQRPVDPEACRSGRTCFEPQDEE